jgi:hypothetical protein
MKLYMDMVLCLFADFHFSSFHVGSLSCGTVPKASPNAAID